MYARCGKVEDALKVFDESSQRGVNDVVSWNSIVGAYVQSGEVNRALKMFGRMNSGGFGLQADVVSLVNILPACGSIKAAMLGKQVHCYAFRSCLFEDVFVGNAIVDMYAKCGMMREAKKAFDIMDDKDVVSWNAMVTAYSQSGSFDDMMHLFEEMKEKKIESNVVTWSAVIAGYAQRGLGVEALDVFRRMQLSRAAPNMITLVSLLSACATLGALLVGKETHAHAIRCLMNNRNDRGEDLTLNNALIDMYAKCGNVSDARIIFQSLSLKEMNVVSWTVMIGGCAQFGDANEAMGLFSQMLHGTTRPNAYTISCALMACSRLGALRSGKEIHAYVMRNCNGNGFESVMLYVANCLIDMYSKCGNVDAAQIVFDNILNKNDVSWTALMTGYGMHGRGEEALQVFDGMQKAGLVPDEITFLVVLYACSHSGMVERGIKYFNTMQRDYGVAPMSKHYACMVDLLGRAGRLDEVVELIKGMPMKASPIVWVSLLSACRIYANVELGEYAAERLLELDSKYDGTYTLLSNIYANAGRWKDVSRIRLLMRKMGIKKRPGCSWVQGEKGTASFFVGDRSHPQSEQIYELLADLIQRITIIGYVPETSFSLHDVDEEEKKGLLYEHSEKLALAYAILTSTPGAPIRITKNLRFCGDCHNAFIFISMIVDHEIIVRDSSRFHHFRKGTCSCRGYW
ncbi:hypothetical protein AQUCO_03800118v1 [Aquilegia coerulea]|uniref:DYW domain-containing protein n=1 Tax=Aquilegia coerulea TaxID=218851 RepID=A0A2G5CSQ8_AQUCA|nr:hypothetical protein AQUCO_03800118v1 [Aquilegia coerulea]